MEDVKQAGQAGLSKSEMFAKLGKPDAWYRDLNVACYKLNELERGSVEIVFGIPFPDNENKESGVEVALAVTAPVLPSSWDESAETFHCRPSLRLS